MRRIEDESARMGVLVDDLLLLARAEEFCDHITRENGKTLNESLFMEVLPVADAVHWYANHAQKSLRDEKIPLHLFPHKKSYLRFYPRGVIGIISPWNYPFSIPVGDAAAALMAGNAVVVKPSEFTPIVMEKTRALLEEAGLPRGLFGVVQGKGEVGAELIRSGINMVVFTGSVATGKKVNLAAAEQMIPCVLELGGKDPAIVLPDADLDAAAKKIAWGAFSNSGQTCASVERVYVHESVASPFIEKVVALAKQLRQGEPNRHDVDVGAMTTQMQVEIVRRHLEEARQRGAKVLAGGEIQVSPDGARFVQPTVLTGTTPDMAIVRDETFGPMLPIMTFRTEEEAIRFANDSAYGLSAYVFVYRAIHAPDAFVGFVVLGGAMSSFWLNVLWSMSNQFFWERENGNLALYIMAPCPMTAILLGMALGGIVIATLRVQPFIVTLAAMIGIRGLAKWFTHNENIDIGFGQNVFRVARANAVNVAQGDVDALIRRNFYTYDTSHN